MCACGEPAESEDTITEHLLNAPSMSFGLNIPHSTESQASKPGSAASIAAEGEFLPVVTTTHTWWSPEGLGPGVGT